MNNILKKYVIVRVLIKIIKIKFILLCETYFLTTSTFATLNRYFPLHLKNRDASSIETNEIPSRIPTSTP